MAKIEHKDVGDRLTPQFSWTIAGVGTDPTQIVVRQQDSAGVETVVTTASSPATLTSASTPLARVSAGVFKLSPGISASSSGYWLFRAEGTGAAEAAEDYEYIVDPSEFSSNAGLDTRALVGLRETKDWLQQQNVDTGQDLDLVRVINDISNRFYEEADQREFKVIGSNPQTRTFDVSVHDAYCHAVEIDDLAAVSTASTAVQILHYDWTTVVETVASTDFTLYPRVRDNWEPYRKIQFRYTVAPLYVGYRVAVTGTWGFPAVPGTVRQAILDAVASTMDRDVESYRQDQGPVSSGQGTNVIVMPSTTPAFLSLPPETLAVARKYRDPRVG
jgi:hypothetical protein